MNSLNTITPKDPGDVDLYIVDFRLLFIDPNHIVSFTVTASSSDITIVSSQQVGKQIQILVGGGVSGNDYSVSVIAVGNDSRTLQRSVPVPVKNR